MKLFDVIIVGAGASGLMCAAKASQRGKRVLVLDHVSKPGTKIIISGGGFCNFSNLSISAENYHSQNKHFCISALKRFTPQDFIALVEKHHIAYEVKNETHLFCKKSSRDILTLLLKECELVTFKYHVKILSVEHAQQNFLIKTNTEVFSTSSLVVATGGFTYPKIGASDWGLKLAEQFGHTMIIPRPALVSLRMTKKDQALFGQLAGVTLPVKISCGNEASSRQASRYQAEFSKAEKTLLRQGFAEFPSPSSPQQATEYSAKENKSYTDSLLFTHQEISGPAVYNITLYAGPSDTLSINLCPQIDLKKYLLVKKTERPKTWLRTILSEILPSRLVGAVKDIWFKDKPLQQCSNEQLADTAQAFAAWQFTPQPTEDNDKAKVMAGGVDTHEVSSKTMESLKVKGLYFIGEVLDVTGEQGGYNLHWAWASGWCAGQSI